MSTMALTLWARNSSCAILRNHPLPTQSLLRPHSISGIRTEQFSTTPAVSARAKIKPRPPPTKAKLAAKERKKALKARKSVYEQERLPLEKAINVLRVCGPQTVMLNLHTQAVSGS